MPRHGETAFRCNFPAAFRNKAHLFRLQSQSDLQDFGRISHFKIQPSRQAFPEPKHIRILNMPAVPPEVHSDSMSPRSLTHEGSLEQIRFAIVSIEHPGVTRLPQSGYVVDVHPEFEPRLPCRKRSHA